MHALVFVLALTSTPVQSVEAFLAALNDADPKITALFTDDATIFFPMNDQPLRADGRAEIEAAFTGLFAQMANAKGKGMPAPEGLRVDLLGEDAAIVTFQTTNPNVTSRRTFVLRRAGGVWKIVHLHGSNIRKN
ncbi:MAG TPA: nuclear transport factor 2 family protein [Thermoanaerobaculia bacterium]|nr:nuclear transport factor 2 family protein [Thermoanaerobaculia bacterium]